MSFEISSSFKLTKEMYYHHTVNKLIIDTQKNSKVCIFSWRYWGKIIRNRDSNKAQRHDNISIHMLKVWGYSICLPLAMIFKLALFTGTTNKTLKIIFQSLYFRFVVKYLKDLFLTKCLSFSPLISSSLKPSLVPNLVIPLSTNSYQLPTKFLYLLILD